MTPTILALILAAVVIGVPLIAWALGERHSYRWALNGWNRACALHAEEVERLTDQRDNARDVIDIAMQRHRAELERIGGEVMELNRTHAEEVRRFTAQMEKYCKDREEWGATLLAKNAEIEGLHLAAHVANAQFHSELERIAGVKPVEQQEGEHGASPDIPQRMEELKVVGFSSINSTPDHHFYLDQLEKIATKRRSVALGLRASKDMTMRRFDEDHREQDIATITAAGQLLIGDTLGAEGDYKEDYTVFLNLRELAERRLNQLIESTPETDK